MALAQLPAGMDCRVELEAAVPVYDVSAADDAVRIAISKTGSMLNPELNYVEIEMARRHCAHCETETTAAFLAADEAVVALTLEMSVFSVDGEQHASRIARKEIGQQLADISLSVSRIPPPTRLIPHRRPLAPRGMMIKTRSTPEQPTPARRTPGSFSPSSTTSSDTADARETLVNGGEVRRPLSPRSPRPHARPGLRPSPSASRQPARKQPPCGRSSICESMLAVRPSSGTCLL